MIDIRFVMFDFRWAKVETCGKITNIIADSNPLASYHYNTLGFRVKKTNFESQSTEYYVRDVSGNIVAIYDQDLDQKEIPLYGSGRLGVRFVEADDTDSKNVFEFKDHLGSVRARAYWEGASLTTDQWRDYYPYGLQMDGNKEGKDTRFGYQGDFAEEDGETNFNFFEARVFDPVIGRWMAVDPARQYASGYVGMGNNPVNGVDPNGEIWLRYWQLEAGAGVAYGLNATLQAGIAYGKYGVTSFTMARVLTPMGQNFNEHSPDPSFVGGADANMSLGLAYDWKYDNFHDFAYQNQRGVFSGFVGLGPHVGVDFGDQYVGVTVGLGYGGKFSYMETNILRAISVTREQKSSFLIGENWQVNHVTEVFKKGVLTGYKGVLEVKMDNNTISNITVFSGISISEEGKKIPNQIWQTQEYINEMNR
ncbi:RHS repeat-associated core domain-containing protein [Persicobacter psychrovividus]|uniref:RHS repeat-associated core domain-containing protein n=1 Tax=Persicobacter psychrovividus TaxID=387638 RepID=A0ABN6L7Q5_9BACT|nr:hypothetical protein PEPS_15220 [Persicobacter psychrovividus]